MPHKDPAARRVWRKAWKKANPEKLAAAARRAYEAKKKREPDLLQKHTARYRAWADANPEQASLRQFRAKLRQHYDLDLADYDRMLLAQGRRCKICRGPQQSERRMSVDHNHETGQVRGLLCGNCNVLVGLSQEQPAVLQAAAAYLERYMGPLAIANTGGH